MSEAYQPEGMRNVNHMLSEIEAVLGAELLAEDMYREGILAPNYPMPAIPTRVVHSLSGIPYGTNQYLSIYAGDKCVAAWDRDVGSIHGNYP